MDRIKPLLFLAVGLFALITAQSAHAATAIVTLAGPAGMIRTGDVFPVEVRVDSNGAFINAVEATIQYSPAAVTIERVGREESPLTLWPEEPTIDTRAGTVRFTGGRPGGFLASHAVVATLYVRATGGSTAILTPDVAKTALYLNDGLGTRMAVDIVPSNLTITDSLVQGITLSSTTHPTTDFWSASGNIVVQWTPKEGATYSYILDTNIATVPDESPEPVVGERRYEQLADGVYYFTIKERNADGSWSAVMQRRFLIDSTPPEQFSITPLDPKTVSGAALISWAASDATSGIAAYTLKVNGRIEGAVTSPLALRPVWRGKTLTVTAKDQSGNERSALWKYPATTPFSLSLRDRIGLFVGILVGAAVLMALAVLLLHNPHRRKR